MMIKHCFTTTTFRVPLSFASLEAHVYENDENKYLYISHTFDLFDVLEAVSDDHLEPLGLLELELVLGHADDRRVDLEDVQMDLENKFEVRQASYFTRLPDT